MALVLSGIFSSILVSYIAYLSFKLLINKKESNASEESMKEIAEHNKSNKRKLKYLETQQNAPPPFL